MRPRTELLSDGRCVSGSRQPRVANTPRFVTLWPPEGYVV